MEGNYNNIEGYNNDLEVNFNKEVAASYINPEEYKELLKKYTHGNSILVDAIKIFKNKLTKLNDDMIECINKKFKLIIVKILLKKDLDIVNKTNSEWIKYDHDLNLMNDNYIKECVKRQNEFKMDLKFYNNKYVNKKFSINTKKYYNLNEVFDIQNINFNKEKLTKNILLINSEIVKKDYEINKEKEKINNLKTDICVWEELFKDKLHEIFLL